MTKYGCLFSVFITHTAPLSYGRKQHRKALSYPQASRYLYTPAMDTQDIVATLKRNEATLRARGVVHAALFGSRARGDNRAEATSTS